jgi:hypothetical protein
MAEYADKSRRTWWFGDVFYGAFRRTMAQPLLDLVEVAPVDGSGSSVSSWEQWSSRRSPRCRNLWHLSKVTANRLAYQLEVISHSSQAFPSLS